MATTAEITNGIDFMVREAERLVNTLREEEWASVQDIDGWKNTQVLAHIAGVGSIVLPFTQNLLAAEEGAASPPIDIDAMNAGLVGARAGKSVQELLDEIRSVYKGVADFARDKPDDFWTPRRNILGYRDVTLGDLLFRMVIMHGLGHIYSVYASIALPVTAKA
jgi:hypothetical protein